MEGGRPGGALRAAPGPGPWVKRIALEFHGWQLVWLPGDAPPPAE